MTTFTKLLLALAGVGLLVNVLLSPSPEQETASRAPGTAMPTGTPAGYEEDLAKRAAQARLQMVQADAARPVLNFVKMEQCIAAKDCAFHVVGVASTDPYLQLSVMPDEANKWTEADWLLSIEFAKERGRWARANPYAAMQQYVEMPESAPFFATAMANISKRLKSVSVGVASGRRSKGSRSGVPGWDAKNDSARTKLTF